MRLAVLGSPIAHSKSPALHRSAYRVLGLDWQYEAIEVTPADLENFIRSRGPEWRGLSLTMPLKRDVMPLLDCADPEAALTGGANTVLLQDNEGGLSLRGFNTDVFGGRAGSEHPHRSEAHNAGVAKSFDDAEHVRVEAAKAEPALIIL